MTTMRAGRSAVEPELQAGRPRPREGRVKTLVGYTVGTAGFEYASDLIGGEW